MIIRDKRTLLFILSFDFLVMLGIFLFLVDRGQYLVMRQKFPNLISSTPDKSSFNTSEALNADTPAPDRSAIRGDGGAIRKIGFSYRNSKPSQVEIAGSFNNWTPEPMLPGPNYVWSATVPLEPGDYTYHFIVDGRPIRDPNNPRTAPEGRSLLTVKPLETPP